MAQNKGANALFCNLCTISAHESSTFALGNGKQR